MSAVGETRGRAEARSARRRAIARRPTSECPHFDTFAEAEV